MVETKFCSIEVMVTFAIPQGVMASKGERSPLTLRCKTMHCESNAWTPTSIEAILRLVPFISELLHPHTR